MSKRPLVKHALSHAFLVSVLASVLALAAFAPSDICAQEAKGAKGNVLHVGDLVEVDLGGKKQQSRIIKIDEHRVYCEVELGPTTTEFPFPHDWVTLIESAAPDSNSDGKNGLTSQMRSWTDVTGSFTVKAKMLGNKNGKIELEKEDGRVITLPAVKLSEKDQAYLKELAKAAAAEADENNPFAGGTKRSGSKSKAGAESGSANQPAIVPEVANSIILSDSGWKVKPDPGTSSSAAKNKIINFSTTMTKHAFHNSVTPSMGPGSGVMGVSISNPFEKKIDILAIDLESGKAGKPASIGTKEAKLFAISGDGKTAVTLKEGRGSSNGSMDFWSLAGGVANNTASWKTKGFHDRSGFSPKTGRFIAPSRLLTFGSEVALWDCETAAALYSFAAPKGSTPIVSPGGNQLAVASSNSIFFVNIKDGEVLGAIDLPQPVQRLAYSENGRFVAGLSSATGEIWVWDLTTQNLVRQFSAPGGSGSSIRWCGNKYVLINGTDLMDVELRATVWKYTSSGGRIVDAEDGQTWFVTKSKVTPITLPHRNLDDKTAKFDPDELLLLKPGSEVSIKLDTGFSPSEEREIRQKLTTALNNRNINVVEGADLEVVGTVTQLKRKSVEVSSFFDPFGRRGGSEKISYTPHSGTLYLVKDGEKLWGKSRYFGPGGVIHSNRGESTQQAANRMCKPHPSFFTTMKFPQYIGLLPSGPLGKSSITAQGVQ